MRIFAISDTHTQHRKVNIPDCDIFIFAGDGEFRNRIDIIDFNNWLKDINAKYKIVISGNHDFLPERLNKEETKKLFTNAIYLEHEYLELEGLKIFGSPYSPQFGNWAFMYSRFSLDAKKLWNQIPKNLDLLITHCPPYRILDLNRKGEHCGCEVLQREIFKKKPKYHIFGHIHRPNHQTLKYCKIDRVNFYNIGLLDEGYELRYKPTIIEI